MMGMVVNYGFNLNIPKRLALISTDSEAKSSIVNEVIITRTLIAFIIAVFLFLAIQFSNVFNGYSIILIYSIIQLFNDAVYPLFILQGLEKLSWIAIANALSKLLYLALVLVLVNSMTDAYLVNFLMGSTGLVIHIILLVFIYRYESLKFSWISWKRIRYWLLSNFQFFSSTVATYILINGGFIMLKSFVNDAELGFFALAQRVAVLLRMVPVFITQSILQNASRLYKEDKNEFNLYLKRSQRNGLMITFLACASIAVCSKYVIRILSGEFIELSSYLLTILCLLPFIGMSNVSNMVRILVAEQKYLLSKAIWFTTILMLLLSLIGSYYYGSLGLAYALVIAEIVNYLITRFYIVKHKLV